MMIPTNYLRHARSNAAKYDGSPPTLQQWWHDEELIERGYGEMQNLTELQKPKHGYGEWRDVETVEGA